MATNGNLDGWDVSVDSLESDLDDEIEQLDALLPLAVNVERPKENVADHIIENVGCSQNRIDLSYSVKEAFGDQLTGTKDVNNESMVLNTNGRSSSVLILKNYSTENEDKVVDTVDTNVNGDQTNEELMFIMHNDSNDDPSESPLSSETSTSSVTLPSVMSLIEDYDVKNAANFLNKITCAESVDSQFHEEIIPRKETDISRNSFSDATVTSSVDDVHDRIKSEANNDGAELVKHAETDAHQYHEEVVSVKKVECSSIDTSEKCISSETPSSSVVTSSMMSPIEHARKRFKEITASLQPYILQKEMNPNKNVQSAEMPLINPELEEQLRPIRERTELIARKAEADRLLFEETQRMNEDLPLRLKAMNIKSNENFMIIEARKPYEKVIPPMKDILEEKIIELQTTLNRKERIIDEQLKTISNLQVELNSNKVIHAESLKSAKLQTEEMEKHYSGKIDKLVSDLKNVKILLISLDDKYKKLESTACTLKDKQSDLLEEATERESTMMDLEKKLRRSEDDNRRLKNGVYSTMEICWSLLKDLRSDSYKMVTDTLKTNLTNTKIIEMLLAYSSADTDTDSDSSSSLLDEIGDYLTELNNDGEYLNELNRRLCDRIVSLSREMHQLSDRIEYDKQSSINIETLLIESRTDATNIERTVRQYIYNVRCLPDKLSTMKQRRSSENILKAHVQNMTNHIEMLEDTVKNQHVLIDELKNNLSIQRSNNRNIAVFSDCVVDGEFPQLETRVEPDVETNDRSTSMTKCLYDDHDDGDDIVDTIETANESHDRIITESKDVDAEKIDREKSEINVLKWELINSFTQLNRIINDFAGSDDYEQSTNDLQTEFNDDDYFRLMKRLKDDVHYVIDRLKRISTDQKNLVQRLSDEKKLLREQINSLKFARNFATDEKIPSSASSSPSSHFNSKANDRIRELSSSSGGRSNVGKVKDVISQLKDKLLTEMKYNRNLNDELKSSRDTIRKLREENEYTLRRIDKFETDALSLLNKKKDTTTATVDDDDRVRLEEMSIELESTRAKLTDARNANDVLRSKLIDETEENKRLLTRLTEEIDRNDISRTNYNELERTNYLTTTALKRQTDEMNVLQIRLNNELEQNERLRVELTEENKRNELIESELTKLRDKTTKAERLSSYNNNHNNNKSTQIETLITTDEYVQVNFNDESSSSFEEAELVIEIMRAVLNDLSTMFNNNNEIDDDNSHDELERTDESAIINSNLLSEFESPYKRIFLGNINKFIRDKFPTITRIEREREITDTIVECARILNIRDRYHSTSENERLNNEQVQRARDTNINIITSEEVSSNNEDDDDKNRSICKSRSVRSNNQLLIDLMATLDEKLLKRTENRDKSNTIESNNARRISIERSLSEGEIKSRSVSDDTDRTNSIVESQRYVTKQSPRPRQFVGLRSFSRYEFDDEQLKTDGIIDLEIATVDNKRFIEFLRSVKSLTLLEYENERETIIKSTDFLLDVVVNEEELQQSERGYDAKRRKRLIVRKVDDNISNNNNSSSSDSDELSIIEFMKNFDEQFNVRDDETVEQSIRRIRVFFNLIGEIVLCIARLYYRLVDERRTSFELLVDDLIIDKSDLTNTMFVLKKMLIVYLIQFDRRRNRVDDVNDDVSSNDDIYNFINSRDGVIIDLIDIIELIINTNPTIDAKRDYVRTIVVKLNAVLDKVLLREDRSIDINNAITLDAMARYEQQLRLFVIFTRRMTFENDMLKSLLRNVEISCSSDDCLNFTRVCDEWTTDLNDSSFFRYPSTNENGAVDEFINALENYNVILGEQRRRTILFNLNGSQSDALYVTETIVPPLSDVDVIPMKTLLKYQSSMMRISSEYGARCDLLRPSSVTGEKKFTAHLRSYLAFIRNLFPAFVTQLCKQNRMMLLRTSNIQTELHFWLREFNAFTNLTNKLVDDNERAYTLARIRHNEHQDYYDDDEVCVDDCNRNDDDAVNNKSNDDQSEYKYRDVENDNYDYSEKQSSSVDCGVNVFAATDTDRELNDLPEDSNQKLQEATQSVKELKLLLKFSNDKIESLCKELMELKCCTSYKAWETLQHKHKTALNQLHSSDQRCERLTAEISELIKERDALQLRLSSALRQNQTFRNSDLQDSLTFLQDYQTIEENEQLVEKIQDVRSVDLKKDPTFFQEIKLSEETEPIDEADNEVADNANSAEGSESGWSGILPSFLNWFADNAQS